MTKQGRLEVYMNGGKIEEHEVTEGYIMSNKSEPYITIHHGNLVVCQLNPRIAINGINHTYIGTALIQSHMILVSTHI